MARRALREVDLPAALGLGAQGAALIGALHEGSGERDHDKNTAIEHGASSADAAGRGDCARREAARDAAVIVPEGRRAVKREGERARYNGGL